MKHIRFIIALFLLCALGCQRLTEEDTTTGEFVIHARIADGDETKTSLSALGSDGMYHPLWTAGDKITVFADGSTASSDFGLVSGAGTDQGTFTGASAGSSFIGFYPSSAIEGLSGNTLTIQIPQEQEYVAGTFAQGLFPMIAVGSPSNLPFKNLCAILKVSMTGEEQVNSITFKPADASKVVSGKATVQTNYGSGGPQLVMTAGGSKTITLNCGAVQLNSTTPTDFFLVIPPGTYTGGFSLDIKTFRGTITKSTTQDITFERSQFRAVPAFECVGSGEDDPDNVPYNQIWYVTSSGSQLSVQASCFNQGIVSNVYEGGKGIITFDGTVTSIGEDAFFNTPLTEIHLPNSVESIGEWAFANTRITEFRTPDNLTDLASSAFRLCVNLANYKGKWATDDGCFIMLAGGALAACAPAAMTETVTLPGNTVSVNSGMFMDEKTIKHIIIPEGVTSLGMCVFQYCQTLERATLPSTLTLIDESSFTYCPNLHKFEGNSPLIWDNGKLLVDANGELLLFVGTDADYVIPEGVTCLTGDSFVSLPNLHSLSVPSTVNNMWSNWKYDCPNLEFFYGPFASPDNHLLIFYGNYLVASTSICPADYTIPSDWGITRIFYNTFNENTSIEHLTLPDEVATAQYCFQRMPNLKTITLSSSLQNLGNDNFYQDMALEKVYLRSVTPPSFSATTGSWGTDDLVIYVPIGFEDQYTSASGWSQYASRIQGYNYGDVETPDYYISTDYSQDGKVTTLQTATVGNGINLVVMGDAYSDRQIADGTYAAAMNKMMEAFFSEEPYTTYRNMFNVYAVTVVSSTEGYDHAGQALATYFGEGTQVGGDDGKCMEYAQKIVPASQMNSTVIIVAMNRDYYAGTCWMYFPSAGDYGDGLSVAYFPTSSDNDVFNSLVLHEAGGHGFAKLGDEYAYESRGAIPQDEIDGANGLCANGWYKNVDFTDDPTAVKWAKFIADARYQYDGLGCFEGAFTYWSGAWRPTDNSIMRYNTDGFNAPSREAIWYRIHKLAYGDSWEYNYEDFVAYDVVNRKTSASAPRRRNYVERRMEPTHAPVVVRRHWNDPVPETAPKGPSGNRPNPGSFTGQNSITGPVCTSQFR